MQWSTVEQLIRILAYSAGSFLFGDAVADGEMYQAVIGGAVNIAAFIWWAVRERTV